jgi:hypothetical protein
LFDLVADGIRYSLRLRMAFDRALLDDLGVDVRKLNCSVRTIKPRLITAVSLVESGQW